MGTKLLKNISKFIICEFVLVIIFTILSFININIGQTDLGAAMIYALSFFSTLYLIPSFVAAICGLRYCLGKNNGKLIACWLWGIISFFINIRLLYLLSVEVDFGNTIINTICILPSVLYLIGCYKEQFKNKA